MKILKIHRIISIFVALFLVYLGVTGSLIEMVDLKGLLLKDSASSPNLQAMRGDLNGPGDYAMIAPFDYTASLLPGSADIPSLLSKTASLAQQAIPQTPLRYVEVRVVDGKLRGIAQFNDPLPRPAPGSGPFGGGGKNQKKPEHKALAFDLISQQKIDTDKPVFAHNVEMRDALRIQVKSLHRMTTFGDLALWINVIVAASLIALLITGVWVYIRQYKARAKMGRKGPFWKAQDWWRTLHRSTSMVCILFLAALTLSGGWLAVESLVFGWYLTGQMEQAKAGKPIAMFADSFSNLPTEDIKTYAQTTMEGYARLHPDTTPRAVRLRVYANYAQGVVIGGEREAEQIVFNAKTGNTMLETEPGYPKTGFPFGWQAHQWAKKVHNGSMIGLTGRWMSFIGGLALTYLSVSGLVMYVNMWRRRRRNGKAAPIW